MTYQFEHDDRRGVEENQRPMDMSGLRGAWNGEDWGWKMKTVEYLNQLEDEVQSLLDDEVFSECDYSTYFTLADSFGVLFQEIDELRKVIEQQRRNIK